MSTLNDKISNFIEEKLPDVVKKLPKTLHSSFNENYIENKDYFLSTAPLSLLGRVSLEKRKANFFKNLKENTIVVCKITFVRNFAALFNLLYVDVPATIERIPNMFCKETFCSDLNITGICPKELTPIDLLLQSGDIIRGCFTHLVSENVWITLREMPVYELKLGLLSEEELSGFYRKSLDVVNSPHITFTDQLESAEGFYNPTSIEYLTSQLGIHNSLLISTRPQIYSHVEEAVLFASNIKRVQNANYAYNSVARGVAFFKDGNNLDAMKQYNVAIEVDADCTEAYVARGALHAALNMYKDALKDLKHALHLKPNHKHALSYLKEVYLTQAKELELNDDCYQALKLCREAEDYFSGDVIVMEYLRKLEDILKNRSKRKSKPKVLEHSIEEEPLKKDRTAEKIQKWLQKEKEKLTKSGKKLRKSRKKSRRRLVDSSSSSESETSSSSDEQNIRRKRKIKKSEISKRKSSLSQGSKEKSRMETSSSDESLKLLKAKLKAKRKLKIKRKHHKQRKKMVKKSNKRKHKKRRRRQSTSSSSSEASISSTTTTSNSSFGESVSQHCACCTKSKASDENRSSPLSKKVVESTLSEKSVNQLPRNYRYVASDDNRGKSFEGNDQNISCTSVESKHSPSFSDEQYSPLPKSHDGRSHRSPSRNHHSYSYSGRREFQKNYHNRRYNNYNYSGRRFNNFYFRRRNFRGRTQGQFWKPNFHSRFSLHTSKQYRRSLSVSDSDNHRESSTESSHKSSKKAKYDRLRSSIVKDTDNTIPSSMN